MSVRLLAATATGLLLLCAGAPCPHAADLAPGFHPRIHLQPASPYFFYWYAPAAVKPRERLVPRKGPPTELLRRTLRRTPPASVGCDAPRGGLFMLALETL